MARKNQASEETQEAKTEQNRSEVARTLVAPKDRQSLNLDQVRADRQAEEDEREAKAAKPTSTDGLFGNTKMVKSKTETEGPKPLQTEASSQGDLSLLRNRDA